MKKSQLDKIIKEEIMKHAVDKREKYATTTKKFKSDLVDFFIGCSCEFKSGHYHDRSRICHAHVCGAGNQ